MSIIEKAGILAISTRLQRLSEHLRKDGLRIYKAFGVDFEPKWFPVIFALHQVPALSVVGIAGEIGYSHPSTIALLKELEKEKLIRSKRDKTDERKRLIQLTEKGKQVVSTIQPVWKVMAKAITEITDTKNHLMRAIEEVEEQLKEKDFFQRAYPFVPKTVNYNGAGKDSTEAAK